MSSDRSFWRGEVERSQRIAEPYYTIWQENLDYYTGTPLKSTPTSDYVNVNIDFYQVEQKGAALFFETPELQLSAGVGFDPMQPGVLAFRALLNALVGPDQMNLLPTVLTAIKDCTCTAGRGAVVVGYQPTLASGADPMQPQVPIHEAWFCSRVPSKKFRAPAEWTSTDFDAAPWLGMEFRVTLKTARALCTLPEDFTGTMTADDKVLTSGSAQMEAGGIPYVDGVVVWYRAALFDDDVIHPDVFRRHFLIEGLDTFADKMGPEGQPDPQWASPYQTQGPDGRLTADSLHGNPLSVLTLRDVPDSQQVPSDAQMTRPLVKEACLFRTQMVTERDINKPKFGYNAETIPPEAIQKVADAMTGSLIPLPAAAFQGGEIKDFKLLAQGTSPRQTYEAATFIQRDIEKTLALDSAGVGVTENTSETATKTAEVAKSRNVRLDAERKRVVRWYLGLVDKVAALALRFCTDPKRVAELIGPEAGQAYLQWRQQILQLGDPRPKFTARPNSQLHLDAAQELQKWIKIYEFMAKSPTVNRTAIEKKIFELSGEDPLAFVAQQPPEHKPEPSLGWSFKGEDVNPNSPQQPIILELLAQLGIQISPKAIQEAQAGAQNQILSQHLLAAAQPTSASAKPAQPQMEPHGGLVERQAPLSKHAAEETGQRPGPRVS